MTFATKNPRRALLIGLALGAVALAVYWPVVRHQFINFDDLGYIIQNFHVRAGLTWSSVTWAFTTDYAANWHPLTWLSHCLDCQLFGMNAGGHHLTSALLHALNTGLLFLLLRRLTGATWRSAFVAALFGLHPLHVESVAWVAERKDVLSTFFLLLTIWAYATYAWKSQVSSLKSQDSLKSQVSSLKSGNGVGGIPDKSGPRELERLETEDWRLETGLWYALALVCFALGLMSKPMLVTLPFVLLLLDYWPLGRNAEWRMQSAECGQAGALVNPFELKIKNLKFKIFLPLLWEKLPFFLLAAVSSLVTFLAQRHSGAVAAVSQVPLGHRVPNALISYVVYLKKMLWPTDLAIYYPYRDHIPLDQTVGAVLVLIVLSVLAVALVRRRPYLAVGWFWYLGTLVPVIGFVQVGLQSMADRYTYIPSIGVFVAVVWGVADWERRRPRRRVAEKSTTPAGTPALPVAALPVAAAVLVLIALALCTRAQLRYWQDSVTLYRRTLAVTPGNPIVHGNLGSALVEQGKLTEAAEQFAEALRLKPQYAEAESNWGFALALQGKLEEAIAKYRAALALKPDMERTRYTLGQALLMQGKRDEAIAEYRAALEINPDWPAPLNDLAWFRATDPDPSKRDGPEAVALAERACRLTGFQQALFVGTLAAAYAEAGRFDEAIQTGQKARQLALAAGQKELADKNRQLLELYRARKAYHEGEGRPASPLN